MEVGDVVSNVELLNCTGSKLYLTGSVPLVVLDGCEAIQIFLSPASRNVKILSSKCSEINVCIRRSHLGNAVGEDEDEQVEMAIPAQFTSSIDANGKLCTTSVDHVGA